MPMSLLTLSTLVLSTLSPLAIAAAAQAAPAPTSATSGAAKHRYMVERTFPAGALAGLDAAGKAQVNANNAELGVNWIRSYANADQTKTWCVYEGPSAEAVRAAAVKNAIPVDDILEIPVDLDPGPLPTQPKPAHRYMIERTFPAGALDGLDAAGKVQVNANNAALGVQWVGSYANADKTKTFCVYEGPSEQAIRDAAAKNGIPADLVTEVPVDLLPR